MNITEILSLPIDEQIRTLQVKKKLPEYDTLAKQYNPDDHDVFSTAIRPMKEVKRARENGQSADGQETYTTVSEDVNRIAVPYQQLIVERAIGFLLGNPVELKSTAENDQQKLLTAMVERTLKDNKSDYFNRKLARVVMSQCEAAELWYFVEDPLFWKKTIQTNTDNRFKLRVKLLTPEAGDKLYPFFDDTGDMVAFSRGYEVTDAKGKITEHFDTYTENFIHYRIKQDGGWVHATLINTEDKQVTSPIANPYGKIPVVYYSQDKPEWYNVQSIIDRYETKMSNFADTNDYFGSPMVKVIGEVTSLPGKTTQGKVIQLSQGSSADYMSWSSAPESEKLEFEKLEQQIYTMTQTPNISFEQMKSLGGDLSGFAIKLMFTDAHMKVQNKTELFGEMFTRRMNLLKHVCGAVINVGLANEVNNLELEPVFKPFLPQNVKEEVEILTMSRPGKPLISQQTAIEQNPLVNNPDKEMEQMEEDTQRGVSLMQQELTGSFN